MFKSKQKISEFEQRIKDAQYLRLVQTLQGILKTEVKTKDNAGREVTDCAATCREIKTMARLALDFVGDLKPEEE